MMNNYNSLGLSRDTWLKKRVGNHVGSPPDTDSHSFRMSWLVMFLTLFSLAFTPRTFAQNITNYAFSSVATGSLDDLSTGSTSLLTGLYDDTATAVAPIGFNFTFMGLSYSHFSANSNGQMQLHSSAGATAIGGSAITTPSSTAAYLFPMAGDNEVGGGIRYKIVGSSPNRKLVVEWNQFYAYFTDITNAGNMQVWLHEGTGKIDFVYGNIYNSQSSTTSRAIGLSSGSTATTAGYVTVGASPTFIASSTLTTNIFAANTGGTTATPLIANLGSSADGSRRVYTFTPSPASVSNPTSLTFSAVSATTATVNWVDNSTNEALFVVTRATDAGFSQNVFVTSVASTNVAGTGVAMTSVQSGLSPGTTYYYRVQASTEGVSSAGVTGSQPTDSGTTYYWVGLAAGADFNLAANWNTAANGSGTARDTATATDVLIIDGAGTTSGAAAVITLAANGTCGQLLVTNNTTVTIQSTTTTQRSITINGGPNDDLNIPVGSTLNLTNANPIAILFSGTSNTGNIAGTYNASGNTSNVITTTGGTGTLVTVAPTGVVNNSIVGSSGAFSGSAATLTFANGSNYTHSAFTTTNGYIPTATWGASSNVTIAGGTTSSSITGIGQSFGNFTYNATGSTATMSAWTSTTTTIQGDLNILATNTGIFRATTSGTLTVNGNVNITGGTFQVGSSAGTMNVLGNTTIGTNGKFEVNSGTYSQRGATFTNNGVLTGGTSTAVLNFYSPTNIAQTFAGSGTVTSYFTSFGIQTTGGLTISHANQIPTIRVNLFNGTITNSNKITIGTGAALAVITQIGAAGNVSPGGSFDVSPTWNLGTGNYSIFYAQESTGRTTGLEVAPSRTFTAVTHSNTNPLTVSGGNLSTGTLTMSTGAGNINTSSSSVLTVTGTTLASLTRTLPTGYINGPLALTLPASLATGSTYTFPVGKGTYNPFVLVNPTTNGGGTVRIQAEVFDANSGGTPGALVSALNTNRYWAASITSGAANFTNASIQLNDTPGSADGVAASATQGGAYDLIGGTVATVTGTSITSGATTSIPGYFVMGSKASASLSNLVATPSGNQCTNVARSISVTVTPGGAPTSTVVLNYSVNGAAPVAVSLTNASGNIWTGTIPTVTPSNATVSWTITATDTNNLTKTESGTSYSDEPLAGIVTTATASQNTVCQGTAVTLNATATKPAVNVGAGATTSATYPNPFYTNWGHSKNQYLVLASELSAAGLRAGSITSLGITINSGTTALTDFSVQMANTTATSMTAFVTPSFTAVYSNATLAPVVGLNTLAFSTPFVWDGTSNVVIQTCFGNGNTNTVSSTAVADNTSYVSVAHWNSTSTTTASATCGQSTVATTYSVRPRFTFAGVPNLTYSWSDGSAVVGTTQSLIVNPASTKTYTVTQSIGSCSVTASTLVTVNPIPTTPTHTNSAQCGTQVPTASVADTNGFASPTFNWYASNVATTALQTSTATTFAGTVSETTTFHVSVTNPTTNCESARTPVTVNVSVPDGITATRSSASVCVGQPVTLTASNTNPTPFQSYTYSWSSTAGSGASTPVAGNPAVITPTVAGTYTYTVTGTDGGCSTTSTVTVTATALPVIVVSPATSTQCEGTPVTLTATSANIGSGPVAIGAGATTITGTAVGNPYNYWYGGLKSQMIYTKAELNAAGISAGNISALSFELTASTALVMSNFTINIGHTSQSVGTTTLITSGLTQVYSNASQSLTAGVNNYTFSSPFNWNNTDNIVVSISWSNNNGGGSTLSPTIKVDTAPFNATSYIYADNTTPAALLAASSNTSSGVGTTSQTAVTATRPRIVFNAQTLTQTAAGYTWTWNPGNLTGNSITVNPSATQTYTVTGVSDATGCSGTNTVTVNVNPKPTAPVATNSNQCGAKVPTASVADPNGFTTPTYKWYADNATTTALQTGTSNTYLTSISATTTFHVSVTNPTTLCESSRTPVTVTFVPADAVTAGSSSATPCVNSAFTLNATSANAGYAYTWTASPAAGSGIATSVTGASVSVTPTVGGTYVYTASATDGSCVAAGTVSVTVVSPIVNASASVETICAGGSSVLTATTSTIGAGTAAVGAGATTTATYSNPLYSAWSNNHTQHLITAAELTAAGLRAGNITSIALNVTSAGTLPMIDLSIKIGTSTASAMTAFVNNGSFSSVYNNASYLPTAGLNTFTFSTPFNWDGTSSVVVEFCHGNSGSSTTMSRTVSADNTSYVSTVKAHVSSATAAATVCGNTTTNLLTYSLRPRFTFGGQAVTQAAGSLVYTWNPGNLSGNSVTVSPESTTIYTVSAYDAASGCTATKDVTVNVNPVPTAPVATNSAQCGIKVPTASVADSNGFTTPTFKWYADNTTTTTLQSSTSTTYTTAISATTTFHVSVVNPTTLCESTRTPVTVTYTAPAAIVVSSATVTGCEGNPLTASVSSSNAGYVYTWTAAPATGSGIATSVIGAAPSIVPTVAGTYVYTIAASDGNCTTSTTITATVTVSPTAVSIAQAGSQCLNEVVTLTATGGAYMANRFLQDMNTLPSNFTNAGGSVALSTTYKSEGASSLLFTSSATSSDVYYSMNTNLNLAGQSAAQLTFSHIAGTESGYDVGIVEYSSNGGTTWTPFPGTAYAGAGSIYDDIVAFAGDSYPDWDANFVDSSSLPNNSLWKTETVNIPASALTSQFRIRFNYSADSSDFYYGWLIDNVKISTLETQVAWTPTAGLYTDAQATAAYGGGIASVVYAKLTEERTYTATAVTGGCEASKSVTLTPVALPAFTVEDASICQGGSTSLSAVGSGNSYTWSPATGLSATAGATVTANPTITTTYTVTALNNVTGCQKTEEVTVTVIQSGTIVSATSERTVSAGQPTTFEVEATGSTFTYQWQVNDNVNGWANITDDYDDIAETGNYSGATTAILSVNNITAAFDTFKYRAIVTGIAPCAPLVSNEGVLNVSSIGFSVQPEDVAVCNTTNTASYTVVTTGDEPYNIQWQMDAGAGYVDIVDGLDASGLTFTGTSDLGPNTLSITGITTAHDNYRFRAQFDFFVNSYGALLEVNVPVVIVDQPVLTQTVCSTGGTATFAVNATGSDLAYQWQVKPAASSTFENITGATSATLTLTNPAVSANGNQYQVIVSGGASCGSQTSTVGTLNINNPTVSSLTANQSVITPGTATFTVASSAVAPTYQWQYSTTGVAASFQNIPVASQTGVTYSGATSAALSVTTSATTPAVATNYYRVVITDNGCSVISDARQLTVLSYCTPAPSSVDNSGITNVTIGTINNNTAAEAGNYGNYTNLSTNITQLSTVPFSITYTTGYTYGTKVWVDFNHDGDFTDSGEEVFFALSTNASPTTLNGSFTVPLTATVGPTRLRVGGTDTDSGPSSPCYTATFGTFEDYTVNIIAAPVCSGAPVTGTITASNQVLCVSGSTTLTVSGFQTSATGITYQWYNSAGALGVSNTPTYTTPTLTADETYYVRFTCADSGQSANTPPFVISVTNPVVASTTPASRCGVGKVTLNATISGGGTAVWYDNATASTSVGTGNAFETPILNNTTTYYVAGKSTAVRSKVVGTGTTLTGATTQPTAFCNRFSGYRGQYVYTATELSAAGLTAGNINSIAFTITTMGDAATNANFKVAMGTTTGNTLTSTTFLSGLTTVFPAATYTHAIGVNVINFTTPYYWNGTSNIVVEVTHAGANLTNNSQTYYTATTGNTVLSATSITATTGTYSTQRLNAIFGQSCESPRVAVQATVSAPPALAISSATSSICAGSATTVPVTISNSGNFDTYTWSPLTGVSGSVATGYTFNPTTTTTYTLTGTNTVSGCANSVTHTVTVNAVPTALAVTPSATSVCVAGDRVLLTASGGQLPATATSGTAASSTTASSTTAALGPNPFQDYYGGTKQQWLYTAAELTTLGFTSGANITAIKLNLAATNGTVLNNVVIKMKNTTRANFSSTAWETGLATVKTATDHTSVVGLNAFTMTTPFAWDGTSNLLVEMSYSNNNGGATTASSVATYSATSFVSTIFYRVDSVTPAAMRNYDGAPSFSYSARNNVVFEFANGVPVTWSSDVPNSLFVSATGAAYTGGQSATVYALPSANAVITATGTSAGGCIVSANANITVTPTYPFYVDLDLDGYGDQNAPVSQLCAPNATTPPTGYSVNNTDCNDNNNQVFPGRAEIPYNGIDENCNGQTDEGSPLLTTKIQTSQCGTAIAGIYTSIGANIVTNATGYRFHVRPAGSSQTPITVDRTVHWFSLNMLSTYDYGVDYEVTVELRIGSYWLGYTGPMCIISSPAVLAPGTVNEITQCGTTLANLYSSIGTKPLTGVTGYKFLVTNVTVPGSTSMTLDRGTSPWFSLTMLPQYAYGTQYAVQVAVKTTGAYTDFGPACLISTPAVTGLVICDGHQVATKTTSIATPLLSRATQYQFEVTYLEGSNPIPVVTNVVTNNAYFRFNQIAGYVPNGLYGVRVRVGTGTEWSPYSEPCEVQAPASARSIGDTVLEGDFDAIALPNPFAESFGIDLTTASQENVSYKVYDMTGRLLEERTATVSELQSHKVGDRYPAGVYNVIVSQGTEVKTLRVIKR